MRRLNIKLLAILTISMTVLCVGVYFVHAWQVESNFDSLFVEAKQAQETKNYEKALKSYKRYLAHAPADSPFEQEGRINIAIVADELADVEFKKRSGANWDTIRQAYSLLKFANIRDPDHSDVKRRLIKYYMIDRGTPENPKNTLALAEESARELLEETPNDVDLYTQLAAIQRLRARYTDAIKTLSKIIGYDSERDTFETSNKTSKALDATSLEAYLQLALIMSKEADKKTAAKHIVDKLVSLNSSDSKAYIYRTRYWRWRLQQDTAEEDHETIRARIKQDLAKARELSPDTSDVMLESAQYAFEEEKYDEAEAHLREALVHSENKQRIYPMLAVALLRQKKHAEALAEIGRGHELMPNDTGLLRVQAELQLEQNKVDEAEKTIGKLTDIVEKRQLGTREDDTDTRYYLQYLKALLTFAKKDWVSAHQQFERVRPLMSTRKDVVHRINEYMSTCNRQLGRSDLAGQNTLQGLLGEVNQMMSVGKFDPAVERMRRLSAGMTQKHFLSHPILRATWINLLVAQAQARPEEDERRWADVDEMLEDLESIEEYAGSEKIVTEANIKYVRGEKSAAGKMLRDAVRGDLNKDVRVWIAWINMLQKEKPEHTAQEIDRAQEALGDTVIVRLLKVANIVTQRDQEPAPKLIEKLAKLEENTQGFSVDDLARLRQGLATAYLQLGNTERPQRLYQEMAKSNKNDPTIQAKIFELALATGDDATADAALKATADLLGTQSAESKHMEAARIVSRIRRQKDDVAKLAEAKTLLADAAKLRPRWDELARLEGEIALIERRNEDALAHLEDAVALGSRNVGVLRQLAALLHAAGRHDEALAKLALLGDRSKAGLTRIEAESNALTDNPERALALARQAIEEEKENWNNRLWYGQLLARSGKAAEAEVQFRRAVELNPEQASSWVVLVAHLIQNDKQKEAADFVRQAEATLPENVAPRVLAQCYELLKDLDRAEKFYRQILATDPTSTLNNRVLAEFYLRTNRAAGAQEFLANILRESGTDKDANVYWARRILAELKANSGIYRDTLLALKLLDANRLDGKQQLADKRLRAHLLGRRPERASRLDAIRLFEELRENKQLSESDLFYLANLHLATGDFTAFTIVMQSLPLRENQQYLTTYIDALVRHDKLKQAGPLLAQLESLDATAPNAIALRARLLHEYQKTDEAVKLLKQLVPDTLAVNKLGMLPQVAKLMEDFDHPKEAAILYRRFQREHPAGALANAAFLGRQGDLDQAFQVLSDSKSKLALPAVIQTGLGVLQEYKLKDHQQKIDGKFFQALESWFAQSESKEPDSLRTAALLPQLRSLQGRLDETMDLYAKLLERKDLNPAQRAMFLNNLAFMYAIRGKNLPESRKMIDEAIDIMGPNSDLLDTRAVTLIGHNNAEALGDLKTSIAEKPDAIKFFHLALVQLDSGSLGAARTAFAQANEKNFDIDALDPAERGQYDRLVAALKKKPKS